ncbi:UPF0481 protein At3g47200-like [Vitis riparia]|uniref:UPF0481 protein At3g47200-like n=1 Tax=Vitis riparia TaxID=96939 RepID=UPI00155A384A|nr:UPF0481 protein At3g47200-like [Vitis riparia]
MIQRKATTISSQDNTSGEAGKEDYASDEMLKKSSKEVATSLQGRLDRLTPLSTTCCIYRVPQKLRKVNMEAYTPRVVSIGPLHHGEEHLVAMEEHKLRYLQNFLSKSSKTLEECVEIISREEKRARDCYMERINMSSKEFVEMILVDGCFIIEVILGLCNTIEPGDRIYHKPWLVVDVRRDMTLLENQLPFFLLLTLYSLLAVMPVPGHQNDYYSFLLLSVKFFQYQLQMPNSRSHEETIKNLQRRPLATDTIRRFRLQIHVSNWTQKNERLFDIDYRRSDGVLKIPRLRLGDKCESLLRNLIAFEQCHYRKGRYITDYIFLMEQLISTTKDVDVLVNKGIIDNWLCDNVAVTNLFNNLLINTLIGTDFHLADITKGLNEYCDGPWNRWKAALRHDYFCSPWRGASTIAAVILLLLTLIQTIFSGMSVK